LYKLKSEGTWNLPIVDFLAGYNSVEIENAFEFEIFKRMIRNSVGLVIDSNFTNMRSLIEKDYRKRNLEVDGKIYLEYRNSKGLSVYGNRKESVDYFGIEPLKFSDIYTKDET
jgi:hypothetical protein